MCGKLKIENLWFNIGKGVINIFIQLQPKSSRETIEGIVVDENGKSWLKVRVKAVAEDGKANAALLRFLSKSWHIPASALSIQAGSTSRKKTLLVKGDIATLAKRLMQVHEGK